MNSETKKLKLEIKKWKPKTKKALSGYKSIWLKGNKAVFSELLFCLCTAQSSALKCNEAIQLIAKENCTENGSRAKIRKCLRGRVRFHNNKTDYILLAQKQFSENKNTKNKKTKNKKNKIPKIKIKEILLEQNINKNHFQTRDWLLKNVKGLGLKEASHFIRNIGFYEDIAILDRHILRNLVKLKIIHEIPASLTDKKYLEIEEKTLEFCARNKIKPEELDLVLWARETGFVFK